MDRSRDWIFGNAGSRREIAGHELRSRTLLLLPRHNKSDRAEASNRGKVGNELRTVTALQRSAKIFSKFRKICAAARVTLPQKSTSCAGANQLKSHSHRVGPPLKHTFDKNTLITISILRYLSY